MVIDLSDDTLGFGFFDEFTGEVKTVDVTDTHDDLTELFGGHTLAILKTVGEEFALIKASIW